MSDQLPCRAGIAPMRRLIATLHLVIATTIATDTAVSQTDDATKAAEQQRAAILDKAWTELETGDSFHAAAFIESQGTPLEVGRLYSNLLRDLYGKKHDVPRMILIGQAGIRYCLQQAQAAEQEDRANELKGIAKMNAYNLSVNTWPAWEDEGIVVTLSDQRIGLDAARLNLRLARQLKRGPDKVGAAHWLLGAHQLGLGNHDAAVEQFQTAAALYRQAKQPEFEQMCNGYAAIARLQKNQDDEKAARQLEESVAALKKLGTEDAKFFAEQLVSVNEFFAR